MRMDGRTDKHDETDNRFLELFCERTEKISAPKARTSPITQPGNSGYHGNQSDHSYEW
jgi:hypothetical protein